MASKWINRSRLALQLQTDPGALLGPAGTAENSPDFAQRCIAPAGRTAQAKPLLASVGEQGP